MNNEKTLTLILGDQVGFSISSLRGFNPKSDVILMLELHEETSYVGHHKQKIALVLSAMRHFAEELRERKATVDYIRLDDPENTGSFTGEIIRAVARHKPSRIVVTEPGEWRVLTMMNQWSERTGLPVEIREDDRFFCSKNEFNNWAQGQKTKRMEFFYREMRRRTGLLIKNGNPIGGKWNFDTENRKQLPDKFKAPTRPQLQYDIITQEVLTLVSERFNENFGDLEGFAWAVTRQQAIAVLENFITKALPYFGDYQDAMAVDEPFVFHAVISPYLNIGLLGPREVCRVIENAFHKGGAPLNAVEGFIRQILGWREYIRGIYWLEMPAYAKTNALQAYRPLPWFYWDGKTEMNCLANVISDTRRNAYAHHIQRLMITGNFALLAGIRPNEVEAWYLAVYADAFEWVELPNTHEPKDPGGAGHRSLRRASGG